MLYACRCGTRPPAETRGFGVRLNPAGRPSPHPSEDVEEALPTVVLRVDGHKRTHTVMAVSEVGWAGEQTTVRTNDTGHDKLIG